MVWLNPGVAVPVSWGGSLFEYLMPLLFYKVHAYSLFGTSSRIAIDAHEKYAPWRTPWGMGESAYNATDINQNYQYQIFGHPQLGLKRDLGNYLVVAPYTTMLALPFGPRKAVKNLKTLIKEGAFGKFGYYDSVDYLDQSGKRLRKGVPAKIYYAHHQGFVMTALCNAILGNEIKELFHSDLRVKSGEVLLEEKVSSTTPSKLVRNISRLSPDYFGGVVDYHSETRRYIPNHTRIPYSSFLSNGRYSVSISNNGSGQSKFDGIELTRYREDPVLEQWGTFIYIFDEENRELWSPTYKPTNVALSKNKIIYSENKALFHGREHDIESTLEVAVSPIENIEIRHLTLMNNAKTARKISVSSYGEMALSLPGQDLLHTMFHRMMVSSEYVKSLDALMFSRPDPRDRTKRIYMAHFSSKSLWAETSVAMKRETFLGRYGTVRKPSFVVDQTKIADPKPGIHYTLDSVFGIKKTISLRAGQSLSISYMSAVADSKENLIKIIKSYRRRYTPTRLFINAKIKSEDLLKNLGISTHQALSFQELASRILTNNNREDNPIPETKEQLVHSLWRLGISGDLPILLIKISDVNDTTLVKQLLQCHKYFVHKGIVVDMVFFNEYPVSYIKTFEDEVDFLIRYHQPERSDVGGIPM